MPASRKWRGWSLSCVFSHHEPNEKINILVAFLWSYGPGDHENHENQNNAWVGDLTKRPREDQNSCGILVVLWTTRPREPQEPKECLGWRFNQETTRRPTFLWPSCGLVDQETTRTTRTKRMPGLETWPRDHEKTKILVVFLWSCGPRDHKNHENHENILISKDSTDTNCAALQNL